MVDEKWRWNDQFINENLLTNENIPETAINYKDLAE